MATRQRRPQTSSIDRRLDELVEDLVARGLAERTEWSGRPLLVTRLPSGRGVTLDPDRVEQVCRFFLLLRQTTGRWAGQEFRLLDWQVRWIVGPLFGVVWRRTGLRVLRTGWVEIPRKNGKSTLSAGIGLRLAFADREPGAQVYAAAGDKKQATNVFTPARRMAEGSDALRRRLGRTGIQRSLLEHPDTGSIFRVLSSDGNRQHGLNVSGAVIDEVHVHRTPDLVDAIETGTGSRTQPLVVFITTADEGADGSIYATKREYLEGVVSGTIDDPTFYGVVFAADSSAPGFDPFDMATIRSANPGVGVTVLEDYLAAKASEARQSPSQLNRYLRLHLGIRTRQTFRWLPLDRWDAAAGMVDPAEFRGRVAFGGLDLSATSDFSAWALVAEADPGVVARWLLWVPEERLDDLERLTKVPLRRWVAEGWLRVTPGNVVDYARLRRDIAAEIAALGCKVDSITYDPWNATETVQLLEDDGFVVTPLQQTYARLSAPSREVERLVIGSTPQVPLLRHGGHPVLRWMADCVEAAQSTDGHIKPVKPDRRRSTKRIDGFSALVNAMDGLLRRQEQQSPAPAAAPVAAGDGDLFRPAGRLDI